MRNRSIAIAILGLAVSLGSAPAPAAELRSHLSVLGQVRDGDQSREIEAPNEIYGALSATNLPYGARAETFFRGEHDFGLDQGAADFYAGYLWAPNVAPGVDVTVGRQFLNEGPGGVFVADAAKMRLDPGGPVAFTVFGGRPQYFEPTYSSPLLSQDEILWGGNMRTTGLKNGYLSLGYLQQERDQREIRQLVTAAGAYNFTRLPGLPSVYSSAAYDSDRQNLDLATVGMQGFVAQPRLLFNLEGSYYRPQDDGSSKLVTDINRREDPIFQLFSVSRLLQFRGGLRYILSRSLSAFGDYSYQRYNRLPSETENGHVASAGLLWLPGGDGLEVVRLEYYLADSKGGNVNGGRAYYESRVYEQILFRTKLDVSYYQKENNQSDTAVSSLLGVGYEVLRGLVCEVYFEANRNQRFDEDYRFGFLIDYNGRFRSAPVERAGETS